MTLAPPPTVAPIRGSRPDNQDSFAGTLTPLPAVYAVYGTLMADQPNARILDGLGQHGDRVRIVGADLYSMGAFPGLVPGAGTVCAQLWRPASGCAAEALERLDWLEGCRGETGMYVRRLMSLADGREATVYVWNRRLRHEARIPDGDWRTVVRDRLAARAGASDGPRRRWQGWH